MTLNELVEQLVCCQVEHPGLGDEQVVVHHDDVYYAVDSIEMDEDVESQATILMSGGTV